MPFGSDPSSPHEARLGRSSLIRRVLSWLMPRRLDTLRLNEESLRRLACREENEQIEFKQKLPAPKELSEYSVGIGNAGGGLLVLGITNKKPRKFVGVGDLSDEDLKKIKSSIHDSARIRVNLQEIRTMDGLNVLVIRIPGRPKGHVFCTRDGKYQIRVGESLVGLSPAEVAAIHAEGKSLPKSLVLGVLAMLGIAIGTFIFLRNRKGEVPPPVSESRSHIHIDDYKSPPQKLGEPAMVNVFYVNDGKSKATVRVGCKISFVHFENFDRVEEAQRQDSLIALFQEQAEKRFQDADGVDIDVPVGTRNFTTCFGHKYPSLAIKLIRAHQFRLYYLGMFQYSDNTGRYRTTFCGYIESDPRVFYVCHKYNDEP